MKKYIVVIVLAVVIGSVFAYFIFSSTSSDIALAMSEDEKVYLFQLGVFSSSENAEKKKVECDTAIVEKINEYYYVYGAVYSDIYLVSMLKDYYDESNIDYSVKETIVSSEFLSELQSYEELLKESGNMSVILRTNQIILDKFAIL